jgi:hypothetical protein
MKTEAILFERSNHALSATTRTNIPTNPLCQSMVTAGRVTNPFEMTTIHCAKTEASQVKLEDKIGAIGATVAASIPKTVIGATTGSAKRFASTA